MSRANRAGESTSQRHQRSRPIARDSATGRPAAIGQPPAPPVDAHLSQLHQLSQTVADIGAALAIAPARLAEGEAVERVEVVARLAVGQLAGVGGDRVRNWFAALGPDLTLDLRLDGLDPDLPTVSAALRDGGEPAGALRTFQDAAAAAAVTQGDDISVEARLSVGKSRALTVARAAVDQRSGVVAPEALAVFYASDAWNQLLTLAAIPYLEQSGLVRADGRTCVLLCDAPGYLAGVALECVGAANAAGPDWLPVSQAAFRQFVARETAARRLLADDGGWPDAPHLLTIERLHLIARASGLEITAARLAVLRTELAAATLAPVVQGKLTEGLTLHFAGVRPAICALETPDAPIITGASGAWDDALGRLADWATRRGTVDTLIIARECLARELAPGRVVSLAEVARASVDALEAAKANFTLFIRGQTDRYFAARQSAQDAVADYAESVRKAVSDLTSDVVDNVYRTVGLLAAVVIGGLIQPAISPLLVLLASVLYTGYIAFVIYFLLRARADRFALEESALTARLDAMGELTTTERQRMREPAVSADAYYRRYMARTRMIYYVLLALGALVALVFVVVVIVALARA